MKPPTCKGCPLENAEGPVWGSGSPNARLIILGQNPGPQEIQEGRPFCGPSGRILDRALGDAGVSRTSNFVTNIVKCYVEPGKPVPQGAAKQCAPLLASEFQALAQATTILTLGAEAFDELARPKKFHVLHDRRVSRKESTYWLRGCPYRITRGERSYSVIPTLHPAFVARTGFTIAPVMEADICKAGRFSRGEVQSRVPSYDYNPSEQAIREYVGDIIHRGEGGIDIETPESAVEEDELSEGGYLPVGLIGLSAYRDHAIGINPDQFDFVRPLLDGLSDKRTTLWAYNAGFDFHHLSRLFGLRSVRPADAMLAFHLLRPEMARKDLGTAMSFYTDLPFHKNLMDSNPELYNAADTYGVLECGQNMIAEMRQIDAKRKERFPWQTNGMSIEALFWSHMMPIVSEIGSWGYIGAKYDVQASEAMELKLRLTLQQYEDWWTKNIPMYSWSSPKQLIELFEERGLKVPLKKRADGRYSKSVDDGYLETLEKGGNQTAKLVRVMRSLRKAGDFLGIAEPDGRVYCRAKPHGQVGGRIQTVNFNMQTIPEEISGSSPRDCIIAECPTDLVISADFSQIEFWAYAWYSKCRRALEIKESGEYLYGAFYEDIWNERFFKPNTPHRKSDRDEAATPPWKLLVAKSWPLGFTYGRGVPNPADQGLPIDRTKAKSIHAKFHRDYPEFGQLHRDLQHRAARFKYLQTVFGRLRRFPNPNGQFNEICAFPGQTTAVDVLIRNVLVPLPGLLRETFGERSRILFTVHDSGIMNVNCSRDGKFSRSAALDAHDLVKNAFEAPIPEMDGFVFPCEVKMGASWGGGVGKEKWLALHPDPTVHAL
jgi:uracil-DNA glycosylase